MPVALLVFAFATLSWIQKGDVHVLVNGKPMNTNGHHSIEELQGGVAVTIPGGFEIVDVYQVRGNRPVKSAKMLSAQELKDFQFKDWAFGKSAPEASTGAAAPKGDVRPGDRFLYRIQKGNGQESSFSLHVE